MFSVLGTEVMLSYIMAAYKIFLPFEEGLWSALHYTKVFGGLMGGVRGGEKTPMLLLSLNQSSLHELFEQQLRRHGDGVDGDAGRVEDGVAERRGRTDERRLAERLVAVYA